MEKRFLIAGMLISLGLGGLAQAVVTIVPFRLEETRTDAFIKDPIGRTPDLLKLTLSISGPETESAAKYGELKLDEAVDDRGTNLIPAKDDFNHAKKMREYSNAFFRKNDREEKNTPADPQIEIELGLPKRSATKIAHLRGSFELAEEGTIKTVEVGDIAAPGVKKLDLPTAAGVHITATVKADEKNSIALQITGDENAVELIEVINASGKKISNGMSSWSFNGGPAHKSLDLESPLDSTMKLVVKVAVDRKMTRVPFDLKDIALP